MAGEEYLVHGPQKSCLNFGSDLEHARVRLWPIAPSCTHVLHTGKSQFKFHCGMAEVCTLLSAV